MQWVIIHVATSRLSISDMGYGAFPVMLLIDVSVRNSWYNCVCYNIMFQPTTAHKETAVVSDIGKRVPKHSQRTQDSATRPSIGIDKVSLLDSRKLSFVSWVENMCLSSSLAVAIVQLFTFTLFAFWYIHDRDYCQSTFASYIEGHY